MADEILEEVWRNRDNFAKRHNYDLDAMVAELKERELQPWSSVISKEKETPNKRVEPTVKSTAAHP